MHILKPVAIIAAASIALLLSTISGGAVPSLAAGPSSPWSQTSYNAAQSRANLTEHTLAPSAVPHVRFLRSMTAQPTPPVSSCGLASVTAPLLTGDNIYAITNNRISKYSNAGTLIWRRNPDPTFSTEFVSLAAAKGLVVTGGFGCDSPSEPGGFVDAYNASTGTLAWSKFFDTLDQMVVAGSHVVMTGEDAAGTILAVLNLSDGSLLWGNNSVCGQAVFVVAQLVVEAGCDTSGPSLNAYKIATGALAWSRPGTWTAQRGDLSGPAARHFYATDA